MSATLFEEQISCSSTSSALHSRFSFSSSPTQLVDCWMPVLHAMSSDSAQSASLWVYSFSPSYILQMLVPLPASAPYGRFKASLSA